ncbi:hypothetical protein V8E51_019724 [Hyaloscypha variabilis]
MKISLPLAIQDRRAQLLAIVKGWRPSPSYSCRAQLPTFIDRMATLYRSIPTRSSTSHLPHSLSSNSTILDFGLVLPPLNLQRVKLHKFVKSQQRVTHHQLAEGELAIISLSAFERMLPPPSPPRERLRRRVPRIVSSLRKESPLPSQSSRWHGDGIFDGIGSTGHTHDIGNYPIDPKPNSDVRSWPRKIVRPPPSCSFSSEGDNGLLALDLGLENGSLADYLRLRWYDDFRLQYSIQGTYQRSIRDRPSTLPDVDVPRHGMMESRDVLR